MKKRKPITDVNDPRGYDDPSPEPTYPEFFEEIYDDYFKDGTKPEDFWDKEEGQAYAAWLKKNPNGRPDF